jgi:hypothetical protein
MNYRGYSGDGDGYSVTLIAGSTLTFSPDGRQLARGDDYSSSIRI